MLNTKKVITNRGECPSLPEKHSKSMCKNISVRFIKSTHEGVPKNLRIRTLFQFKSYFHSLCLDFFFRFIKILY